MIVINAFRSGTGLPANALAFATTPTGNVFDFTALDLTPYQRVVLYLDGLTVNSANTNVLLQLYIAGSLQTSSYRRFESNDDTDGSALGNTTSQAASAFTLAGASDTGADLSTNSRVEISNGPASLYKTMYFETTHLNDATDGGLITGGGTLDNNGAMDGLKVSGSGGLITGGQAMLLGIPTS